MTVEFHPTAAIKTLGPKQLEEQRVDLPYTSGSQAITGRSQSRNLEQKPAKDAPGWLVLWLAH